MTLGEFDAHLPAWVQQNNIRTTYTLDVVSHRLVSTTGPNGGAATSTTTRHYTDGSENPAWADVDYDAAGPDPALTTRIAESLGGDLGVQVAAEGSADLTLATLHSDTATTVTLPAAQGESTSTIGINGWSDYTEYGTTRNPASADAANGPVGYGWLGAEQRSTTPESAGPTLMGEDDYDGITGRFTAAHPEAGGNVNNYTYPLDPTSAYDLDGHHRPNESGSSCKKHCRKKCKKHCRHKTYRSSSFRGRHGGIEMHWRGYTMWPDHWATTRLISALAAGSGIAWVAAELTAWTGIGGLSAGAIAAVLALGAVMVCDFWGRGVGFHISYVGPKWYWPR